jgi:hypothetical protein
MKKQASDQQSHERRYQERKRAEAAKKPKPAKKAVTGATAPVAESQTAPLTRSSS